MAIKEIEIEIGGIPHTVQVNDADKAAPSFEGREIKREAAPATRTRTRTAKARAPRNKAVKPADKARASDPAVEGASDPGASAE